MKKFVSMLALAALSATAAHAQKSAAVQAIEEYRAMLADGNPAELFEAKGEDLWKKKPRPQKRLAGAM